MPQGTVIAVRPVSLADDANLNREELRQTKCSGEVEILDGEYAGQLATFDEAGEKCTKRVGEKVELKVVGSANGKLQAKLA